MSKKRHLFIMRGLPGSGKSKIARHILQHYRKKHGCQGEILSTDDYFRPESGKIVDFDRNKLETAHKWNRSRAKDAMKNGVHPIFIDNTNIRCWEMKPYVQMGLRFGYCIFFRCASFSWKLTVEELYRRTNDNVPLEVITGMKNRFETTGPWPIDNVLNSSRGYGENDKSDSDCS